MNISLSMQDALPRPPTTRATGCKYNSPILIHILKQSYPYVHVAGFLSVTLKHIPSLFCSSPPRHLGLACGTPLVLFCNHSVTLLIFCGKPVLLVHSFSKYTLARKTSHAAESHASLTGALVCQRDVSGITRPGLQREVENTY